MDKKKLVVFDMDGTLTTTNSWDILNAAMGIPLEDDRRLYSAFHAGNISYSAWIQEIVRHFQSNGLAHRDVMLQALARFVLRPGASEMVQFIKSRGDELAIISGATNIAVDVVADHLAIEHRFHNTQLMFHSSGELSGYNCLGGDADVKALQLSRLSQKLRIPLQDCVPIGDSLNDKPLFELTRNGITFDECACLHPFAQHRIPSLYSLEEILYPTAKHF